MPIRPNIIQIMTHTVNASVLTISMETPFALLVIPMLPASCVRPLFACVHSGRRQAIRAFSGGLSAARRTDDAAIVRTNYGGVAIV